ncbi:hypothetical protein [Desulforamulus aquiferis]|uniref:Uncharacterized protein n=1 Tax=Desulforamulus aquiferis TaxID=1397668 RepID=A0AAW7ZFD7_9FIRM|nr:hypothetical protein [Desulforamulus aquiferis]MDO7787731.1 hypothetical protein [Desulforamulus aquiferis]
MNQAAQEIKRKRITFTLVFISLTVGFYLINWQLAEANISETIQQYVYLAGRIAVAGLYLWFGYAVGISKQTTWFMSMLAILPVVSWLGLLYLLYKSGQMELNAKKGITTEEPARRANETKAVTSAQKPARGKKKNKN